jgi:hypothetical protein
MKVFLIFFNLLLLSCASSTNKINEIPEWFFSSENNNDHFIGVGDGDSKDKAMIRALSELLIKVQFSTNTFNQLDGELHMGSLSCDIGLISFEYRLSDYIRTSSEEYDFTESTAKLTFKGRIPIIINDHLSLSGYGFEVVANEFFEVLPNAAKINEVYEELSRNGIKIINTQKSGKRYFMMLSVNVKDALRFEFK